MARIINPEDWDQCKAGIALIPLLYHLEICLHNKRMTPSDTERYIRTNIMRNPASTLTVKKHPEDFIQGAITVTYLDNEEDQSYGGFSCTIKHLYKMRTQLERAKKLKEKANESSAT